MKVCWNLGCLRSLVEFLWVYILEYDNLMLAGEDDVGQITKRNNH